MKRLLTCSCREVRFELLDEPIMTAACYCESCRLAGEALEMAGVDRMRDEDGSTHYVIYRKDKVLPVVPPKRMVEYRLRPDSTTRRIIAACCDTPMFLEFERGHWFSVYAGALDEADSIAIEERTMLSDMPIDWRAPDDGIRNSSRQSVTFFGKLFWAWVRMGFRAPAPDWISGTYQLDS